MRPVPGARPILAALAACVVTGCRVTPPWERRTTSTEPVVVPAAPPLWTRGSEPLAPSRPGPVPGPDATPAPIPGPPPIPVPPSSRTELPPPRHVSAPRAPPFPTPLPVVPAIVASPARAAVPPDVGAAPGVASPPAAPEPRTFREWVDRLRRDAASGADDDLAAHASLLEALALHPPAATAQTTIVRVPELEAAALARHGGGLGFATITSYVEPDGDADALRRVYLDFDRVPEFTGKPGTRTLAREPGAVLARADALRKTLGFEYGARWTFRARRIDRGEARLIVSTMVPAADTAHMIFTQGLFLAVPEADGLHVAEIATSVMDYAVPALLKGIAEQSARREMLARTGGLRAHWREYDH